MKSKYAGIKSMKELDSALKELEEANERKKDLMKVRFEVISGMGLFVNFARFLKKIFKV